MATLPPDQIIEQKNYYKERCFILEDELRELKGQRHETLLASKDSPGAHTLEETLSQGRWISLAATQSLSRSLRRLCESAHAMRAL